MYTHICMYTRETCPCEVLTGEICVVSLGKVACLPVRLSDLDSEGSVLKALAR